MSIKSIIRLMHNEACRLQGKLSSANKYENLYELYMDLRVILEDLIMLNQELKEKIESEKK